MVIREPPSEISKQLRRWTLLAGVLRALHIVLGTMATVCSLLVAAKINSFDRITIEWLSFGAAVAIGLLSAFDLGSKANRFRRAWRRLNIAVVRFSDDENFSKENLFAAYEAAEEMIGDVKEEPA